MKILIVGNGVIGTLYAIALAEQNEIHHYVRENKFREWNKKQIKYDMLDERLSKKDWHTQGTYTFTCVDKITESYDLIIVPVNSYQLCDVLKEINEQAPNANYLFMTLNWNGTGEIDSIIDPAQYVMGYAGGGGTYKDGRTLLWGNIGSDVMIGKVHDSQNTLLKKVEALFSGSKIKPEIPSNVLHALWLHNVGTAPFGVAFTKHNSLEKTINDKALVRLCFRAMKECYKLCARRGVDLKKFPETKMYSVPFFILYPLFKKNMRGEAAQRYTAHALLALDEMKCNFYEMLDTAGKLNVQMPNMEALQSLL